MLFHHSPSTSRPIASCAGSARGTDDGRRSHAWIAETVKARIEGRRADVSGTVFRYALLAGLAITLALLVTLIWSQVDLCLVLTDRGSDFITSKYLAVDSRRDHPGHQRHDHDRAVRRRDLDPDRDRRSHLPRGVRAKSVSPASSTSTSATWPASRRSCTASSGWRYSPAPEERHRRRAGHVSRDHARDPRAADRHHRRPRRSGPCPTASASRLRRRCHPLGGDPQPRRPLRCRAS